MPKMNTYIIYVIAHYSCKQDDKQRRFAFFLGTRSKFFCRVGQPPRHYSLETRTPQHYSARHAVVGIESVPRGACADA
eukprot:1717251-Pyramimonas_sp.AAC.1